MLLLRLVVAAQVELYTYFFFFNMRRVPNPTSNYWETRLRADVPNPPNCWAARLLADVIFLHRLMSAVMSSVFSAQTLPVGFIIGILPGYEKLETHLRIIFWKEESDVLNYKFVSSLSWYCSSFVFEILLGYETNISVLGLVFEGKLLVWSYISNSNLSSKPWIYIIIKLYIFVSFINWIEWLK